MYWRLIPYKKTNHVPLNDLELFKRKTLTLELSVFLNDTTEFEIGDNLWRKIK